jgi:type II secretory pathway component PulF
VVAAGERSGKLEEALQAAAAHVADRIALRRAMAIALAYPTLVAAAALVLMPIPTLVRLGVQAAVLRYYLPAFVILGGLGLGIRTVLRKAASPGGEAWEERLDKVPLLGGFLEAQRASRFFATLAATLDAGLSATAAYEASCRAAGSSRLEAARAQGCRELDAGTPLSRVLPHPGPLGDDDVRQVILGEEGGALPGACRVVAEARRSELSTKGTQLAVVVGLLAMLVVGLAVVWYVVSFWTDYFQRIGQAGI